MHTLVLLLALGFACLIAATVVVGRLIGRTYKTRNAAAVMAYRIENGLPVDADEEAEPDPDDLDAKWSAYWHEEELAHRNSALWLWLHEDEESLGRQIDEILAKALDTTQEILAIRGARTLDRTVKGLGFAGAVDMFAQWVYARRRSVKRTVAVLDKTKTWPKDWQTQLDVLMSEGALARARDKVRA